MVQNIHSISIRRLRSTNLAQIHDWLKLWDRINYERSRMCKSMCGDFFVAFIRNTSHLYWWLKPHFQLKSLWGNHQFSINVWDLEAMGTSMDLLISRYQKIALFGIFWQFQAFITQSLCSRPNIAIHNTSYTRCVASGNTLYIKSLSEFNMYGRQFYRYWM